MIIGAECFDDIEIRSIIISSGNLGTCEITGIENTHVYDTNDDLNSDISAYLTEILDIYTPKSELPTDFPANSIHPIEEKLYTDWSIFKVGIDNIKKLLIEICKDTYSKDNLIFKEEVGIEKICDTNCLKNNCLTRESTWEAFMSSIKNINRFHSNHINLELLEKLFKSQSLQISIPKSNTILYRARISDESGFDKSQMGPPPSKFASAGRANSEGIRCLYLASDVKTVLHEIRARDLDYISIGKFIPKRHLKVVNLSNLDKISPFSSDSFDYEWFAINMPILKKINYEIAKPLRRQDSELDYLPAQYISDFVKSLGFDGICYRSTLNTKGLNYAIFDHTKFKCTEVNLYHVSSLDYITNPSC